MNEFDVLDIFYDQLRAEGLSYDTLFISIDESTVTMLKSKLGVDFSLADLQALVDICIANEWMERTTADQEYKYLSLTEAGLNMAIEQRYRNK